MENKLNSNNYGNWAANIKYILLDKNAWEIVINKEIAPETTHAATSKDFQVRSHTALSLIYLNVQSEFRRIPENTDDPHAAWLKMKTLLQPDNRSRHMMLFAELIACKIQPDEAIDMFAARIQRIAEQLKAMNEPVKEICLSFQLPCWLSKKFIGLVQTTLQWTEAEFTFQNILTELVAEESCFKSSIQANFSKSRPKI